MSLDIRFLRLETVPVLKRLKAGYIGANINEGIIADISGLEVKKSDFVQVTGK